MKSLPIPACRNFDHSSNICWLNPRTEYLVWFFVENINMLRYFQIGAFPAAVYFNMTLNILGLFEENQINLILENIDIKACLSSD